MIDCFDGLVVSWSMGTRSDAELVNTMLDAAIDTVITGNDRPVVHSDRGGHYRWPGWPTWIADARLIRSMSSKACSPDNAACDSFFSRLKNELLYARDWLNTTIDEFMTALDAYIRWYNEARIKMSLGSRSPVEHHKSLGDRCLTNPSFLPHPQWQSFRSAATALRPGAARPCPPTCGSATRHPAGVGSTAIRFRRP